MKVKFVIALCALLSIIAVGASLYGQLAAPTPSGVSLGAVYYTVPDVAMFRKLWVDVFGAKPVMVGKTEMLKIPGAFIVLSKGDPASGNPLVNHLGIWAKDLDPTRAKLTAAGIQVAPKAQFVDLPNGVRWLEFIDDANGPEAPAAHHIHYFVANADDATKGRAWYVKEFGASENSRRNGAVPSALLTSPEKWISIDFTAAGGRGRGGAAPAAPTSNKGTMLDRFALEVKGIDAFVKKVEADGVNVTKPVSTNADGLKTAMILDAVGNDVELIEGLSGK